MPSLRFSTVVGMACILGCSILGCSGPTTPPPLPAQAETKAAKPDNAETPEAEPPKTPEQLAKEAKLRERYEKQIAKLPKEEAEAARAQKICPVMEKPLGSMGMPVKVEVQGRTVYICCEGCREELLEKPDESLARIPPKK